MRDLKKTLFHVIGLSIISILIVIEIHGCYAICGDSFLTVVVAAASSIILIMLYLLAVILNEWF